MNKDNTILLTIITLLYRNSLIKSDSSYTDLVNDLIDLISKAKVGYGDDNALVIRNSLIELIRNIIEENQDKSAILMSVRSIVDDDMYSVFAKGIEEEYDNDSLLINSINNLLNFVNEYYVAKKSQSLLSKAGMHLKSNRESSTSPREYVQEVINELEEIVMSKSGDVDGITETIDLVNDGFDTIVDAMKEDSKGENVYRLGWGKYNDTLQGGLRPGEYFNISALSHNNKTGIFDTHIVAIAYYNKPIKPIEGKKPTILVFKTEDELSKTFTFMFKLLKMTEEGINPNLKDYTREDVKKFLADRLLRNGWNIIFHNTDPSMLTYRSVMKRVYDLEAKGHEIKVCGIDYLTKMSTVGCTMGPHGTDKRDLVKRLMTFFKARNCVIMSPSQTNTAANNLLEDGIEPYELPKIIAERGMYADSRQLHQEFDLSTQQQKFVKGGKPYLAIMREKHRTAPEILEEHKKYLILPFPSNGGPIPMDLDTKPIGYRNLDQLMKHANESNSMIK